MARCVFSAHAYGFSYIYQAAAPASRDFRLEVGQLSITLSRSWGTAVLLLGFAALLGLAAYFILRARRRGRESLATAARESQATLDRLTRAEGRFRVALEGAPSGVMMDQGGKMVLVNRETGRLFGHARCELLGEPIEKLIPARYRGGHPDFRNAFFAQPQARAMGAGRELFGLLLTRMRQEATFPPVIVMTGGGHLDSESLLDMASRLGAPQRFQSRLATTHSSGRSRG
jgi:PAS domain-containing protein